MKTLKTMISSAFIRFVITHKKKVIIQSNCAAQKTSMQQFKKIFSVTKYAILVVVQNGKVQM